MAPPTQRCEKPEPEEEDDVADPGFKEFIPLTRPSLVGGTYAIQVQQAISEDKSEDDNRKETDSTTYDPSTLPVKRQFEVLAPKFHLPADSVYSIYPEQGHEATHDTLPHIVLNDSNSTMGAHRQLPSRGSSYRRLFQTRRAMDGALDLLPGRATPGRRREGGNLCAYQLQCSSAKAVGFHGRPRSVE